MFRKRPKARKLEHISEIEELAMTGKPVLIDFYQVGCAPCQVMDGIFNELAREYGDSAHVVKADIGRLPGIAQQFQIRSTPTMVLLTTAPPKKAKKPEKGNQAKNRQAATQSNQRRVTLRWRASGLVKKDQLTRLLESNGATRVDA
ncbi:MAG: thioredoxin family protein [Acidimicrobiia bacterium]